MARKIQSIERVEAIRPFVLSVFFSDGTGAEVDLAEHLAAAPHVFGPLLDNPDRFAEVELGEYGAAVGWYFDGTDDMEVPADLLWRLHLYETDKSMAPSAFSAWRERMEWTVKRTAEELDVSRRTVEFYESGRQLIPAAVVMATKWLEFLRAETYMQHLRDMLDTLEKGRPSPKRTGTDG